MTILVTGAAGFIGFHLCRKLLKQGYQVLGFDNFNNYYDVNLKKNRLKVLENEFSKNQFKCVKDSLENFDSLKSLFSEYKPSIVINLAAQAGVRYSLENPKAYIDSNINGFLNILECCRNFPVKHLLYASSSSVYGGNVSLPFSENHSVDHPVSLYAATKKSNELMAHSYSHLYNIPATGMRIFTAYGPWGRPDMALFIFTKSIFEGNPIQVFNYGKSLRDFTYIEDVIESINRLIEKIPQLDMEFDRSNLSPQNSWAPHRIFNIGNSKSVSLIDFIDNIEKAVGKKVEKKFLPLPQGDVVSTYADTEYLESVINFKPNTPIEIGIRKFVSWYEKYYIKI